MQAFGEILPYHENKMYLDQDDKDSWGLPKVVFDAEIKENELNMRKDMMQQAIEMFEAAGAKEIVPYDKNYIFGNGIHEMGTARMGDNPKNSVLNSLMNLPNYEGGELKKTITNYKKKNESNNL